MLEKEEHYHLIIYMSRDEVEQMKDYLHKLTSMTVTIEPLLDSNETAVKLIKDVILRVLGAISNHGVN